MKKMNIVKKNSDFTKIIAANLFVKDRNFVIYALPTEYPYARFGVSVGKKIGKAVTRNYYKRQIRNIIDNHKNLYSKSRDYNNKKELFKCDISKFRTKYYFING